MTPVIALFVLVQGSLSTAPAAEQRTSASVKLDTGLAAVKSGPESSEAQLSARLRQSITAAATELGTVSLLGARLRSLAAGSTPLADLQREASAIAVDLVFTPVIDADRPRGFPGATPVGEVLVLDYPACRLARVTMKRGIGPENSAFWKLFQHIESNRIPMTAPVEMTYDAAGLRQTSMAFLYASTDVGRLGSAGEVEVVDVAPLQVASFGLRGRRTDERVLDAKRAIEGWLASRSDLEAAGNVRVMGWNGPTTPSARSYFEVQIPVRAKMP